MAEKVKREYHKTTNLELKGARFGKIVVLEEMPERVSGHVMWRCMCDCGVETIVRGASLPTGNTNSCGCLTTKIKKLNKYGKLRAMERFKTDDGWKWRCECDCGNEAIIQAGSLTSGNTRSCGCLNPINENLSEKERKYKRSILTEDGDISYDTWRKHVRFRDSDTCVVCGYIHSEKYDMTAHHMDAFNWCEERRTDISNGATLCSEGCHREFHNEYSTKNNTEEQFKEFYLKKTGKVYIQPMYEYVRNKHSKVS